MVSDYVMLEQDCRGSRTASDPVGLAAYTMDSHNVQRIVLNGHVKNEGDVQVAVPQPFPISYRSIVPKVGECSNLLVPWCLSSSHMAFGSIRMEAVFMILGQSAAPAAAFAIDDEIAVQQVPYAKLRAQLLSDGQVLTWGDNGAEPGLTLDNSDTSGVMLTGAWSASSSVGGFIGANYLHNGNTGKGSKSVRFTPSLASAGSYQVSLRWTSDGNRATNVPVDIVHTGGTTTTPLNQQTQGWQGVPLGTFEDLVIWRQGGAWIDQVAVDDDGLLQPVHAMTRRQATRVNQRFLRLRVGRVE
jgi:hypothetical protein